MLIFQNPRGNTYPTNFQLSTFHSQLCLANLTWIEAKVQRKTMYPKPARLVSTQHRETLKKPLFLSPDTIQEFYVPTKEIWKYTNHEYLLTTRSKFSYSFRVEI